MKILTYQNYLAIIKASQGSKIFRQLYVLENGKKKDILKNGRFSCAYYVSSILKIFDLISSPHATVGGTVKDILKNGWRATKTLKPGNVLVWEEKLCFDAKLHQHIGFYLGNNKAISNSHKKGVPALHHFTYNNKRKIIRILTHKIIR